MIKIKRVEKVSFTEVKERVSDFSGDTLDINKRHYSTIRYVELKARDGAGNDRKFIELDMTAEEHIEFQARFDELVKSMKSKYQARRILHDAGEKDSGKS